MSNPVGFFSYVRFNDESEEGRLTEFREKLENEVSMLSAKNSPYFRILRVFHSDRTGQNGSAKDWQRALYSFLS
jgi:hypothetical protein